MIHAASNLESRTTPENRYPGWYWVINLHPFDYPDEVGQLCWDAVKQEWIEHTGYERSARFVEPVKRLHMISEFDITAIQRLKLDNEAGRQRINDLLNSFMFDRLDVPMLHRVEHHLAMHLHRELSFAPPEMVVLNVEQIKSHILVWADDRDPTGIKALFSKQLVDAFDLQPVKISR